MLQTLPHAIFLDKETMQSLGFGMVLPVVFFAAAAAAAAIPAPGAFRVTLAVAASMPYARRRCSRCRHAANTTTAAAAAHSGAAAVGSHPHLHLVHVFFLFLISFKFAAPRHRTLSLGTASIGLGIVERLARVRGKEKEDDQPQGHARLSCLKAGGGWNVSGKRGGKGGEGEWEMQASTLPDVPEWSPASRACVGAA